MNVYSKSHVGMMRSDNQDCCYTKQLTENCAVAAVCDGMGGVSGGKVASEIAVKAIAEGIDEGFSLEMSAENAKKLLHDACTMANSIVYQVSNHEQELSGMGTTVVAVLVMGNCGYIYHAGDSRCYKIGSDIVQITKDHSFVQEMIDLGQISELEAKNHPKKNIITRALGIAESIELEFTSIELNAGEKLLLCTDGLTNHVPESEILSLAQKNDDPTDALIALANERGGSDNITVAVISA